MAPTFAELRAKAAEKAGDTVSSARAPATKYKPVRPEDVLGQRMPTSAERFQQSTVLQHSAAIHRPPPPPIRSRSSGNNTAASPSYAPAPPAQKFGGASPAPPPRNNPTPPAPPPRNNSGPSVRPTPAPPYQHALTHDIPTAAPSPPLRQVRVAEVVHAAAPASFKKFSQYGTEEKEELFALLDEFFEARLGAHVSVPASQAPVTKARALPPAPASEPAPPPISLTTRPRLPGSMSSQTATATTGSVPSYPPPQPFSSSALTLAHSLLTPDHSQWYTDPSCRPPGLVDRTDVVFTSSWSQSGSSKVLTGFALFGDTSTCWWRVSWDVNRPAVAQTEARYRPIPQPFDGEQLYADSERYGPKLCAFAENAVASGRPIGRGECWDVAAEGLKSVGDGVWQSVGRTHGHLLYYAKAGGDPGLWKGGDAYVRSGDVVEWRTVRITEVGAPQGSYSMLGDPDHTAVILHAGVPTATPANGDRIPISALTSLTVVEQSQGHAPKQATYDITKMTVGEVWIYRPVNMKELIGCEVEAKWPPPCESYEVGQLE